MNIATISLPGFVPGDPGRYAIPARRASGANASAIFPASYKEV